MYKVLQTYDNLDLRPGHLYRTPPKVGERLYLLFTASRQMRLYHSIHRSYVGLEFLAAFAIRGRVIWQEPVNTR